MTKGIAINTSCNLACEYCYEHPSREVTQPEYDVDAIMDALEDWKEKYPNDTPPGLHGGEPMLIPDDDMERFLAFINENWDKRPWIQTNGSLIEEHHIEMFKEHNVHVGISVDGPGELNQKRKSKDGNTAEKTEQTMENIHRLHEEDVPMGIIVVLHEHNAGTDERFSKLLSWIDDLNKRGITGHFNIGRMPTGDLQLSPERYGEILIQTLEWVDEKDYRWWDPVCSIRDGLQHADIDSCKHGTCDPRGTNYAKTISGNGEFSGCGRMWSQLGDGNPLMEGPSNDDRYGSYSLRYEMLRNTPQDAGGCRGCPYWDACHGGCPANGMADDYRKKTVWCTALKMFFNHVVENADEMGIELDPAVDPTKTTGEWVSVDDTNTFGDTQ